MTSQVATKSIRLLVSLSLLGLLAACGGSQQLADASQSLPSDDTTLDQGFVAGDGSITYLPVAERLPAPALEGPTLDGGVYALPLGQGKIVVVNVWASWCAPCRAEAPVLEKVAKEFASKGVQFVGLNIRDSLPTARAFAKTFGIAYPNIVDKAGELQVKFGSALPPQAIPSTVVIDQQDRVAGRVLGRVSESSLRGLIELLLVK